MIFANGNTYEGGWKDCMKSGEGKFTYTNGNVYEGHFLMNMKHGQGTLTYFNGIKNEGRWEKDNFKYKHSGVGLFSDD